MKRSSRLTREQMRAAVDRVRTSAIDALNNQAVAEPKFASRLAKFKNLNRFKGKAAAVVPDKLPNDLG